MEIGRKIIHLNTVDSTNNYTANLVKQGEIVSGTVILADEQTAGRGQRAANWHSSPGQNLTFTFFLDNVNLSVDRQFALSQIVALGLVELLKRYQVDADIKWPNDIYVKGKKISGVLIENQLQGQQVKSSIVGVGLNVNQLDFGSLDATSICSETNQKMLLMDVLFAFVQEFNSLVQQQFMHSPQLNERYKARLLYYKVEARYADAEGEFFGTIEDVLPDGKLVVRKDLGDVTYDFKEIEFKH